MRPSSAIGDRKTATGSAHSSARPSSAQPASIWAARQSLPGYAGRQNASQLEPVPTSAAPAPTSAVKVPASIAVVSSVIGQPRQIAPPLPSSTQQPSLNPALPSPASLQTPAQAAVKPKFVRPLSALGTAAGAKIASDVAASAASWQQHPLDKQHATRTILNLATQQARPAVADSGPAALAALAAAHAELDPAVLAAELPNDCNIGSCLDHFEVLEELGRGSFGVVHLARSRLDSNLYVLKRVEIAHLSISQQRSAIAEVLLLQRVPPHTHVIKYHTAFVDESATNLWIVMEYAENGDLETLINALRVTNRYLHEDVIWRYFIQLCSGLQHLHNKRIVHRDIKTLNILISADNQLKICDLGGSRLLTSGALFGGKVGTPLYLAPEVLQQHPYDYKADVWSLGCLIYTLATRLPPFLGKDSADLSSNILHSQPRPLPSIFSAQLASLIGAMLNKNPAHRPTIAELSQRVHESFRERYGSDGPSVSLMSLGVERHGIRSMPLRSPSMAALHNIPERLSAGAQLFAPDSIAALSFPAEPWSGALTTSDWAAFFGRTGLKKLQARQAAAKIAQSKEQTDSATAAADSEVASNTWRLDQNGRRFGARPQTAAASTEQNNEQRRAATSVPLVAWSHLHRAQRPSSEAFGNIPLNNAERIGAGTVATGNPLNRPFSRPHSAVGGLATASVPAMLVRVASAAALPHNSFAPPPFKTADLGEPVQVRVAEQPRLSRDELSLDLVEDENEEALEFDKPAELLRILPNRTLVQVPRTISAPRPSTSIPNVKARPASAFSPPTTSPQVDITALGQSLPVESPTKSAGSPQSALQASPSRLLNSSDLLPESRPSKSNSVRSFTAETMKDKSTISVANLVASLASLGGLTSHGGPRSLLPSVSASPPTVVDVTAATPETSSSHVRSSEPVSSASTAPVVRPGRLSVADLRSAVAFVPATLSSAQK